jgi:hypothetical protein
MGSQRAFARKNLMVDEADIRALRVALGASTESEAVRTAVRDRLVLEEIQSALSRIRARGGIDDVFGRSTRRSPRRRAG